ncbi:hypothetical protein HMPREF0185_03099 [Brevundimonas diminuta 470-4]|nr:hypothetical protein HMPREF0185_03099 [Brevundimonas diminuta 470-4]
MLSKSNIRMKPTGGGSFQISRLNLGRQKADPDGRKTRTA